MRKIPLVCAVARKITHTSVPVLAPVDVLNQDRVILVSSYVYFRYGADQSAIGSTRWSVTCCYERYTLNRYRTNF